MRTPEDKARHEASARKLAAAINSQARHVMANDHGKRGRVWVWVAGAVVASYSAGVVTALLVWGGLRGIFG